MSEQTSDNESYDLQSDVERVLESLGVEPPNELGLDPEYVLDSFVSFFDEAQLRAFDSIPSETSLPAARRLSRVKALSVTAVAACLLGARMPELATLLAEEHPSSTVIEAFVEALLAQLVDEDAQV